MTVTMTAAISSPSPAASAVSMAAAASGTTRFAASPASIPALPAQAAAAAAAAAVAATAAVTSSTTTTSSSITTMQQHQQPVASLPQKIIFSGLSGAIATTCIYPLDLTKTKLQHHVGSGATPWSVFTTIARTEGLRGLYRGWPPNVLFVMPEKAIKLTMNDVLRGWFRRRQGVDELSLGWEMAAGGGAGFCQVIMTNPMELLKIQGATMAERIKKGELKAKIPYSQLIRELGVTGLYTGVISTLMRDVPFSMVYFSVYAKTKEMMLRDAQANLGLKSFLAGAIAGTLAAAITCPIDVIKTRVHAAARPQKMKASEFFHREFALVPEHFTKLVRDEGTGALFKGILPRCLIISPLFAITMSCFEMFQATFVR